MTVIVHLNHGINKSYLITMGNQITRGEVRRMVDRNDDDSLKTLITKSETMVEISDKEKKMTERIADFIMSQQGYSAERLA